MNTRSAIVCRLATTMRGSDLYRHVTIGMRGTVWQVLYSTIRSCRISEVLCPTTTIQGRPASVKTSKEWQNVDEQMAVEIR